VPQAFSVSTSVSAVPTAPAAPSAPAAAPAQDNSAPADFLGQLKTALKNLTKAVKPPAADTEPVPQLPAIAQAPVTDAPAAPPTPKDSAPVDDSKDALPDLLATLGFVPVPIAFAPPQPAAERVVAPAAATAAADAALPAATAAAQLPVTAPQAAPIDLPQAAAAPIDLPQAAAAAASQARAPLDVSQLPQPAEAPSPLSQTLAATQSPRPRPLVVAPATDTAASTAPEAPAAPGDAPTQVLGPAITLPRGQPALHQVSAPTSASADAPPPVTVAAQQSAPRNFSGQTSSDDRQQSRAPLAVERIDDTPSAPAAPTIDAAIAAAAGSTVANAPVVLPAHVRPAEVVSQIAHQADLYRLPGNRGVRVLLHPEDLGGVEVTLRYGAGGALQLHINVEHAATGSLVQAGWTELRDALATQGISPDRLVMSVTAPSSSSQLDFSGGGSGRQTDPGMTSFGQSQSGQQRQDNSEQTGPHGWNGAIDPASSSDDTSRVASTGTPTSRIDYRA
jgi:flagellar hook-length control protein FliK